MKDSTILTPPEEPSNLIVRVQPFTQTMVKLKMLIMMLERHGCIKYKYLQLEEGALNLKIKRKVIPGKTIYNIRSYTPELHAQLDCFMKKYRNACDSFNTFGYGFIMLNCPEITNIVVGDDGELQIVDFETSFITTDNREAFYEYWNRKMEIFEMQIAQLQLLGKM
jgi:hypothetical protein